VGDAFTPRQLVALTTFSDLVAEAREKVMADALVASGSAGILGEALRDGGAGSRAYAEAISVYLSIGLSRLTDISNSLPSHSPR